jgi:Domain of unknown function (DUF397)
MWRKSSKCYPHPDCVEVGTEPDTLEPRRVRVRDTKARGTGPELAFSPRAWRSFLGTVKTQV